LTNKNKFSINKLNRNEKEVKLMKVKLGGWYCPYNQKYPILELEPETEEEREFCRHLFEGGWTYGSSWTGNKLEKIEIVMRPVMRSVARPKHHR
jgi:hypothetical protein